MRTKLFHLQLLVPQALVRVPLRRPQNPQVVEDAPPPPEPNIPASLARIHQKLNNETELYKPHLKHYHMSVNMFKHRTSALKLPKDIVEKYEAVVKKCEHCQKKQVRPTRSRIR